MKKNNRLLQMDFPALPYTKIIPLPSLLKSLKVRPLEVYESTFDLLIILENELDVKEARPDFYAISELNNRGVIL